jgi:hypothetical protein
MLTLSAFSAIPHSHGVRNTGAAPEFLLELLIINGPSGPLYYHDSNNLYHPGHPRAVWAHMYRHDTATLSSASQGPSTWSVLDRELVN